MNKKVIYLILVLILMMSCTAMTQAERNKEDLINTVIKCIDSGELRGKVIGVYKSRFNHGNYDLYLIGRFNGIIEGEGFLSEIIEKKNKYILLCSEIDAGISEEVMSKFADEAMNYEKDAGLFYFAQCRSTGKNLLVKAANNDVASYEIPEIREFTCSDKPYIKKNVEVIATFFSFGALDDYVLGSDTLDLFPINYSATFTVYNRSDSCLFFGSPNDSFGYFAILNGKDTLFLNAKPISLPYYRTENLDYKENLEKFISFSVKSKDNHEFFQKIDSKNYHQNLLNLLRDSTFYFPSRYYGEYVSKKCIYPKERLKIITSFEEAYSFSTPHKRYYFRDGSPI